MSPDGRMYAYGGSKTPEVRTVGAGGAAGQLLEVPPFFNTVDGAVTQLKWIDNRSLAIGTALGYLHVWSIVEAVSNLPFKPTLPIGTLDCHIVAIEWAGQGNFHDLFGLDSFTAIPRALSFEENGNIRVFSLHDGCLHSLDGTTGKPLAKPRGLTDVIGYATVDEKKGLALICHTDGFSMHQLPTHNIEGTYLTEASRTTKPKPIMFAENGCRVITGSDHGKVYVFKTEGGKPVDILQHAAGDMVQSITTYSDEEWSTIVCATSSDDGGRPSISFWADRQEFDRERRVSQPSSELIVYYTIFGSEPGGFRVESSGGHIRAMGNGGIVLWNA
ncbi:WD40-repeat-containing domain protein [Ganoderma leucocontextum]|nr:WD40-repeat-containing domain protein [Ganoderma leucocontextum]